MCYLKKKKNNTEEATVHCWTEDNIFFTMLLILSLVCPCVKAISCDCDVYSCVWGIFSSEDASSVLNEQRTNNVMGNSSASSILY